MPSHKHKKKKKSHKKTKKTMSSSDDEEGFWKVPLIDSDSDESSKSGEKLTSLVRRSYMNHIKHVLIENINSGLGNDDASNYSVQELASKWCKVFDRKALRASMLTDLYRKSMISSIKDVKARTKAQRLYVDEKMLSKLEPTLSMGTQTEEIYLNKTDNNKQLCEAETQTDQPQVKRFCVAESQTEFLSSLLDLPLPKSLTLSPSSRPYDPAIDISDSPPDSLWISRSQQVVTTSSQDVCSITSTSDVMVPQHDTTIDIALDKKNLQNSTVTSCDSNINITVDKIENSKRKSVENSSDNANEKSDLDARLTALGLLNDNVIEGDGVRCKKSNWYAEEVAQSCNLSRILLKMTTKQRKKVLLKMKELFGDEKEEPLAELSEANIRICRKRIASVVVMELTPIYQAKRIASRFLFKYVAKKITDSLMAQSLAPDSRSVREKVRKYFSNGHVIMSEADCS